MELAIQARGCGVFTIGLSALDYSSELQSEHASGKRLFGVVGFVIDNAAPYGDARLSLEGVETAFCPALAVS